MREQRDALSFALRKEFASKLIAANRGFNFVLFVVLSLTSASDVAKIQQMA